MKLTQCTPNSVIVTLSKRNLLALLHKVDDSESARTIVKQFGPTALRVIAEQDDLHYNGATPGPMVQATEDFIDTFVINHPGALL